MRLAIRAKSHGDDIFGMPFHIFRISGQSEGFSVWNASVLGKNGKNCRAILDPVGVNGNADM